MKVKSFLLTALAASMTFVACDNKDDEMGQLDNTPKSVSINLPNVISAVTRSAGQEIEDQKEVSLTDLQVFFTDGTNLVKGKTAEGAIALTISVPRTILTAVKMQYFISCRLM